MTRFLRQLFSAVFLFSLVIVSPGFAENYAEAGNSGPLNQYPQTETAPTNINFPKVQTPHDEEMAQRFSWWPTDAKPGPVKDENKSGYWWWPDTPGVARPWGNQGWIYVRKVIFDYK